MTPTHTQLVAHNACTTAMLDDPDLTGDLLLIGLHWARAVHLGTPELDHLGHSTAQAVYGQATHGPCLATTSGHHHPRIAPSGVQRVWDVIRSDIRRYAPDTSRAAWCQRPIRRSPEQAKLLGKVCGRATTGEAYRALFVGVVDGARNSIGCCSQPRCVAWWQALRAKNQAEINTHGRPEPVANTGGILARHLPDLDWERIYRALCPKRVPPRVAEPWRRPTLTVIVDLDHESSAGMPRPALSVIKGGWR